jgi:hypothetical protein
MDCTFWPTVEKSPASARELDLDFTSAIIKPVHRRSIALDWWVTTALLTIMGDHGQSMNKPTNKARPIPAMAIPRAKLAMRDACIHFGPVAHFVQRNWRFHRS